MYEHILVCPLSACFRASGYPQRPSLARSVGIVVHAGQEILAAEAERFPAGGTDAEFRQIAAQTFDSLLEEEKRNVESSARPLDVAWDTTRIRDARSAFILGSTNFLVSARSHAADAAQRREREIVSADRLVIGTPDLVISDEHETRLVDLKTGPIADGEFMQRYIRQLHIYAYIWHSIHGIWPTSGTLRNPTTKREHSVLIELSERSASLKTHKLLLRAPWQRRIRCA